MLSRKYILLLSSVLLLSFAFVACDDNDNESLTTVEEVLVTITNPDALPLIAHRGCWSGDSLPQNSLAAFQKALQLPILGTEFDVRQTLDDKLVINHGATFDSLDISKTKYSDLCLKTLGNGETISLLEDFLRAYVEVETKVLLVVELKSCNVELVIEILKQYDVLSRVLFISFSKNYCNYLVSRGFGQVTYYLGGNLTPQAALDAGYGGINYSHAVFQKNPCWIEEAKAIGLKVGVYTVNNKELIKGYLADSVMVTTDRADKWESYQRRIKNINLCLNKKTKAESGNVNDLGCQQSRLRL